MARHPDCFGCLHDNGGSPCDDGRRPEKLDPLVNCKGRAYADKGEREAETMGLFGEVSN